MPSSADLPPSGLVYSPPAPAGLVQGPAGGSDGFTGLRQCLRLLVVRPHTRRPVGPQHVQDVAEHAERFEADVGERRQRGVHARTVTPSLRG